MTDEELLGEQLQYYRERAGEYDEWFLRQGRYDRGAAHRKEWFREVGIVEEALRPALPDGSILELACGTGLWTKHLVGNGRHVVAVDASPEAIALNRRRLGDSVAEYVVADLFSWSPTPGAFDAVVFAFWLSHVPEGRFEAFWRLVATALKPSGRVFFVDSLLDQASTATDHAVLDTSGVVERRLNNGQRFRIVKRFYEPREVERTMGRLGWCGRVLATDRFFLYGWLTPTVATG